MSGGVSEISDTRRDLREKYIVTRLEEGSNCVSKPDYKFRSDRTASHTGVAESKSMSSSYFTGQRKA